MNHNDMGVLLTLVDPESDQEVASTGLGPGNAAVIGCSGSADIVVKGRHVSHKHLIIECETNGKLAISDLSLKGQTFVNGVKVPRREWVSIEDGASLLLGDSTFFVKVDTSKQSSVLHGDHMYHLGKVGPQPPHNVRFASPGDVPFPQSEAPHLEAEPSGPAAQPREGAANVVSPVVVDPRRLRQVREQEAARDRALAVFEAHLEQLRRTHRGDFVAVDENGIVSIAKTSDELLHLLLDDDRPPVIVRRIEKQASTG